jgi:GNAT superfamily N-acetyltransferase
VVKDIRRRATACCVVVKTASGRVAGYYTLAAVGIPLAEMPPELAKELPRYPSVPVARLGRLAVDQAYRGRKFGRALLWDAITIPKSGSDDMVIPEEWKSSRRVWPNDRAQIGVYFLLIEDPLGVRPPHGFNICGDSTPIPRGGWIESRFRFFVLEHVF